MEVFTTMRDGVKLAADVYLPEGKGPWPVIVSRTPYLKQNMYRAAGGERFVKAGYAYVVQDVRGKGHSQGFYAAFANDIEDGYDTVEGLATEPWSNGKIGITGTSAMGIASNLAAIARPPHLKAAFVIVAPNETFSTSFLGGVPKDKDTVGWMKMQGVSDEAITRSLAGATRSVFTERLGPGPLISYAAIPIWNVGGWYDIFNTGTVKNFEFLQNHGAPGARGNQRLTMGPFGHGALSGDLAYAGEDDLFPVMGGAKGKEVRWFDYWLKGIQNGVMDEPPVELFVMVAARKGAYSPKNHWVKAGNWPLPYRETRYYLETDHGLSKTAPDAEGAKTSYRFDPANPVPTAGGANLQFERGPMDQRAIKPRQDYLRFQTPALDNDITIAGPVTVELYGATDGPDTDFEAKLVDVYPDGYEALVLDAPIRTRYRNGRRPEDVAMMTPGAPEKLVIDLWNTAITFEKGHRIAVHITSSNSPRFVVNHNNGDEPGAEKPPRVATNTVYFDKAHPSAIVLPVVWLDDAR
ncbi:CocE/NonD family hydrolase [Phenylobacterium sp.]|uniref:CocE/NonD family hydrolase n=1 Tax=Phenylobacterium sp. TaxID=1871053 RepID=UPI00121BF148|nr:CocE/NonD family hydrolase [Phenylobacterium sp.]THD63916.1 MAG: CocE/NonD family hydrolase [Phenylobacterium sp.]